MPDWEQDDRRVEFAKAEALKIPGVHTVYVGLRYRNFQLTDELALCVIVRRKQPLERIAPSELVPSQIAGIPTDVIEGDPAQPLTQDNPAQPTEQEVPTFDDERYAQIRGGIPIEGDGGKGTLACIGRATDAGNNGRLVLLSNHHVLANKGSGEGASVRQPDVSCCCCGHKIAVVRRTRKTTTFAFYRTQPTTPSIDAGIAFLEPGIQCLAEVQVDVGDGTATHLVTAVIPPAEIKAPLPVKKRGRRTGTKHGRIVGATADGFEGTNDKDMAYRRQLLITPTNAIGSGVFRFTAGGDSGSAVMTEDDRIVGLLWGATVVRLGNQTLVQGIATKIQDVTSAMQISIETTNTAGQVITVPAAQPNAAPAAPGAPAPQPVTRSMIDEAQFQIERTAYGHQYATTVRRHHTEVRQLVSTNRRVGAIWKRYGGQSILQAILDAVARPDDPVPAIIGSHSLVQSTARIAMILRRYGSPALRRDVSEFEHIVSGVCGCTYNQLLARLQAGESFLK